MTKLLRWIAALVAAGAVLAGCATGHGLKPGMSREEVLAHMGRPTATVRLRDGGERLQYSLQPAGRFAWMADLDASGRLASFRQVLTEAEFSRIEVGRWTRDDVLREFGRPAWVDGVANWNGPVLTYRWESVPGMNYFYWIYLDPQGVVRRAHPGADLISVDVLPNL